MNNAPEAYDPLYHDTYGNAVEGFEDAKPRRWKPSSTAVWTAAVMAFVALVVYVLSKKAKSGGSVSAYGVVAGGAPSVASSICDTTHIKTALEALKAIRLA